MSIRFESMLKMEQPAFEQAFLQRLD